MIVALAVLLLSVRRRQLEARTAGPFSRFASRELDAIIAALEALGERR